MKKIFRELRREFPFSEIEITNGNHLRLQLPNGRSVFASATPSDRRAMLNTRAEVRRQLKDRDEGGQP